MGNTSAQKMPGGHLHFLFLFLFLGRLCLGTQCDRACGESCSFATSEWPWHMSCPHNEHTPKSERSSYGRHRTTCPQSVLARQDGGHMLSADRVIMVIAPLPCTSEALRSPWQSV